MGDLLLLLALLEPRGGASWTGVFHFFVGVFLVLSIYTAAWSFTYWISKDE